MLSIGFSRFVTVLSLVVVLTAAAIVGEVRVTAASPAAQEVVVAMTDMMTFDPQVIAVPAGTTVTWVNQGIAPHTVMANDGSFNSGSNASEWILGGGSFSFTFDAPGTYDYICEPHAAMGMVGTVVVE